MITQVTATYIAGVLRPDESVDFSNNTRVSVAITPLDDFARALQVWESLKERIRDRPVHGGDRRFTRDELHERN